MRACLDRRLLLLFVVLSGVSLGGYLIASALTYRIGFPLDDAWIHQAYARNLALLGEWSFLPGKPSAGSTSPLWAGLLAVGHLLRLGPYAWTFLLGWITLAGMGVAGCWAVRTYLPEKLRWAPWVGAALIFEWHMVWAAGSGMETLLTAVLFVLALIWLALPRSDPLQLGMLIGLGAWLRPDAITLLGPLALVIYFRGPDLAARLQAGFRALLGFSLFFLPYLGFNRVLAGAIWPNTFYAKQAEYALLQLIPYWLRYLTQARLPLVGAGLLLLPGFLRFVFLAWRRRQWAWLAGVVWWLGYVGIYAWRLPVAYQHGRYLMPAMPVFFLWGAAGMIELLQLGSPVFGRRVASRVWASATLLLLVGFWFLGARSYARDTAFIETEMVAAAGWIAEEAPADALIAAHDIGAIGYFGGRDLLDMAGLVSPDVIPFIRDEVALSQHLDENQVTLLVTFPSWYPYLTRSLDPIYVTLGEYGPALGQENMAIYVWDDG
jgi:hypothetical protein